MAAGPDAKENQRSQRPYRSYLIVMPRRELLRLAAITVVALLLVASGLERLGQPVFLPRTPPTVAEDVVLGQAGIPFAGLEAVEVRGQLETLAAHVERQPRDAYLDPGTRTAVPSVDGMSLDAEATAEALLSADPGTRVRPVYAWEPAAVTLADIQDAPIMRGPPERQAVAFAINVAWGGEFLDHLDEILDILRDEEVSATFFLVGQWAEDHPVAAREIAARGHEIAAHGYRDIDLTHRGLAVAQEEVAASQAVLRDFVETEISWFSPPYGAWDDPVLTATEAAGLRLVLWSIDTVDWQRPGVMWMQSKVLRELHPGGIILTHPTEQVPQLLRQLIPRLKGQQYDVVSVGQLLDPAWEPDLGRAWQEIHGAAPD